ncbi:S8 family serine peptidase [Candidatus Saccharibacteria bacterium]|nr:S8 family serine peptidase [Candidatus Saccharibacteria bacterium]
MAKHAKGVSILAKLAAVFLAIITVVLLGLSFTNNKSSAPESTDDGFTAGVDYVPEEVIALADSTEQAQEIAAAYNVELKSYDYGVAVFATKDSKQSVELSKQIQSELPTLSLNLIYHTLEIENPESIGVLNTPSGQWHHEEMDTERAWDITTGEGVLVAIIDTGIDTDHPAFEGRISTLSYNSQIMDVGLQYVEDDRGHGTHVAGIVAGNDNRNSVYGVAPDAEILVIKANVNNTGVFYTDSLLRAINYATVNGAAIINMSLGRAYSKGSNIDERTTIQNSVTSGVTIVCAAGNDSTQTGYPAAYPETIAVSATKQGYVFDNRYSNYGSEIDVAAPGTSILSADYSDGGYVMMSGTSMASPNVAGTVALIKSLHPEYTPAKIREVLHITAQEAGELGKDDYYGYGIISAYAAVLEESSLINVTYENFDGLHKSHTIKVAPGSKLIVPKKPSAHGILFGGWFSDEEYNERFDFSNIINKETSIYGSWIEFDNPEYNDGLPYSVEFPDPIFREFVLKITKKQEDDILTASDKETLANYSTNCGIVRQLCFTPAYIDTSKLKDLTGINYFSNITRLNVNNSRIEELDVTGLNKLISLGLLSNYNLKSVNVSNLLLLQTLNVSENGLSSLDVSSNVSLTYLNVRYNGMKSTEDVIGWKSIGLIENDTFLFNSQTPIINITLQPSSRLILNIGEISSSVIVAAETVGTRGLEYQLKYQWYVNDKNSNIGGIPIGGATDRRFYIPTTLTSGPYYYYCEITALLGETVITSTTSEVTTLLLNPMSPAPASVTYDKSVGGDIVISIVPGSFELSKVALSFGIRNLTEGVHYTINGNEYTFKESMLETLQNTSSGSIVFSFIQNDVNVNRTISVPITVTGTGPMRLSYIGFTTSPIKWEYYVGEVFDPTGMTVLAVYNDGTSRTITNYTYSPNTEFTTAGSQTITISYTEADVTRTATIGVTVKDKSNNQIISTLYKIDGDYISGVIDETLVETLKNQLDNNNSNLYIFQSDGTTAVSSGNVGTGMIVKLIIAGDVKDEKIIIVMGDVNGDGVIDTFDGVKLLNHYLGMSGTTLVGAYLVAADTNKDGDVDTFDGILLLNHYLGIRSLF